MTMTEPTSIVRNNRPTTIVAPSDTAFGEEPFLPSNELQQLMEMLRSRHDMPTEITVECLWKRKGGESGGKVTLGKCVKLGGLTKHFGGVDFVIWLAADHLRDLSLSAYQIEALMFHELQHAGQDDESLKPIIIGHDFTGFRAELEHYGAWMDDLRAAKRSFEQTRLFAEEAA